MLPFSAGRKRQRGRGGRSTPRPQKEEKKLSWMEIDIEDWTERKNQMDHVPIQKGNTQK